MASPAALEFSAKSGGQTAREGELLSPTGGPVTFNARANAATGGVIVLRKDGRILTQHPLPQLQFEADGGEGAYRLEVYLSNSPGQPPVPWIVSNPIYVRPSSWAQPAALPQPKASDAWSIQGGPWHAEKDAGSTAQVTATSPQSPVDFVYRLAGGGKTGQYAALAVSAGNALRGHAWLAFRARASHPMRISVQARRPAPGERWQRSIYLDTQERDVVVPFHEMSPVGTASTFTFDPAQIDTVLFVVDTTNSLPGSEGSFRLSNLRVEH